VRYGEAASRKPLRGQSQNSPDKVEALRSKLASRRHAALTLQPVIGKGAGGRPSTSPARPVRKAMSAPQHRR
jgi:hypothetical protein